MGFRITFNVLLNNIVEVSKWRQNNEEQDHEPFSVKDSLSNQSNEIRSISEKSHPIEYFDPHYKSCNSSNCSNYIEINIVSALINIIIKCTYKNEV